jgi:hypothetical protein
MKDVAISLLSQHPQSQDQLASISTNTGFDLSYNHYSISLKATFNKNTHLWYTVQYDLSIFICVQSGDIHGA